MLTRTLVAWQYFERCLYRPRTELDMLTWVQNARSALDEITTGVRFLTGLPSFLRQRVTVQEARTALRQRLERRQANFLALARNAIYARPESPYRQLLDLAGCTYPDMESLVNREGVEGALRVLYRHGVYLTVDESKGRCPVVRGSGRFQITLASLRNPAVKAHLVGSTGGSRGARTPVPIGLASVRDDAANLLLEYSARGALGWVPAVWSVPGSATLVVLIRYILCGVTPARWFSTVDPGALGLHARYAWSARGLRWAGLLAGMRLPSPVYVPVHDPLPVASWMAEVLTTGQTPLLHVHPSRAVRICQAVREGGLDLCGAQFMLTGEPITAARLGMIRQVGAQAHVRYVSTETGSIGRGCLMPEAPDEVHLLHDSFALTQPGEESSRQDLPARALLVSTLLPEARLVLINVSLGDQGEVLERSCGCPLEQLGWTTHIHTIRSFEKLTAGGMTFLDRDVIRVLEEVLPRRFGGVPTDYQLVDEEGTDGQPRLRLLVNPRLGPLDGEAIRETFLDAIGPGSGVERLMAHLWRDAGFLVVERKIPRVTGTSKIHHVHLERRGREE